MTPEQRRDARERCEKASAGTWYKEAAGCCGPAGTVYRVGPIQFTDRGSMGENNADFVVHARTDLPDALKQIGDDEGLMRDAAKALGCVECGTFSGAIVSVPAEDFPAIKSSLDAIRARVGKG